MLFSSSVFLFAFLPAVLLGYYVIFRGMRRAQNGLLLASSLLFYAWGEPWFVLVMMGSILANYLFGRWVHAWKLRGRRLFLPVSAACVCNLGLLFVFKYLTFTLENLNLLGLNTPVPVIELPIGISFFTFQAMSYVLDVAMGTAEVQRSPFGLGLYISLFPQLIAGPIVKYATVADEIQGRKETWDDFSAGCCRFLVGLGKKVLLSNQLALVADAAWDAPAGELSAAFAWLGSLCYTLQIYYDFSGYSDMAIGLGRMFGFHFLENFNYPYLSGSIKEFWRRWHISLSSWFRDYLYIPLGGNRKGRLRTELNKGLVFLCTGLWHGASWNFVLWGLWHGAFIVAEDLLPPRGKIRRWAGHVVTPLVVLLGFVLFRADTLPEAGRMFSQMVSGFSFTLQSDALLRQLLTPLNLVTVLLGMVFSFPLLPWLRTRTARGKGGRLLEGVSYGAAAVLFCLCAMNLAGSEFNPFI